MNICTKVVLVTCYLLSHLYIGKCEMLLTLTTSRARRTNWRSSDT